MRAVKEAENGSFERRSAGKCSRDGCKKCNLRCNLHYLHQGNLKFVIYLLTCTPPTFFRNPSPQTEAHRTCGSESISNMAEAAHPWPEYIHQSFNSAIISDPGGRDESVFYGPFNRLLNTLFPVDGPYEIVPQFKSTGTRESIDFVIIVLVEVNRHPVFFYRG